MSQRDHILCHFSIGLIYFIFTFIENKYLSHVTIPLLSTLSTSSSPSFSCKSTYFLSLNIKYTSKDGIKIKIQ